MRSGGGDGGDPGEQAVVVGRRDPQGLGGIAAGQLGIAQRSGGDQVQVELPHLGPPGWLQGSIGKQVGGLSGDSRPKAVLQLSGQLLIRFPIPGHQVKALAAATTELAADGLCHLAGAAQHKGATDCYRNCCGDG